MAKVGPANTNQIAKTNHNQLDNVTWIPPPYKGSMNNLHYDYKESPKNPSLVFTKQGSAKSVHGSSTILSFPEEKGNSDATTLVKNSPFSDKVIKLRFIRKVYGVVLLQLVITGLTIFQFMLFPRITLFIRNHIWECLYSFNLEIVRNHSVQDLMNMEDVCSANAAVRNTVEVYPTFIFEAPRCPTIGMFLATFICFIYCKGPRRKVPYNYIFLLLFMMSLAMIFGIIACIFNFSEILISVIVTFAVVLTLTLFTFQTRWDFTIVTGFCLSISITLILLGVGVLAISNDRMRLVYTTLANILISIYIVCDTYILVGDNHRYNITPDEYVFATLVLNTDFMYLFVMFLWRMFRLLFL